VDRHCTEEYLNGGGVAVPQSLAGFDQGA